jgi:4-diphosphocytidyl-2-C-methyl-D-erythritol kinase
VSSGNAPSPRGAKAVEVAAQAKINLRLRILARETSGYHQLETLFLRIDLADTLRIRRTPGPCSLDITGDFDPALMGPAEKNLAWRAAEMYFAATEMRGGYAIELEKRIPIGGGLGGGSADAGAVLRVLSAMDDDPMEAPLLLSLAAKLGADVPFLTTEHAYALAWGRGERMLALAPPPARDVLLVIPAFSVNTAEAFGWLAPPEEMAAPRRYVDSFALRLEQLSDWTSLRELATNDFEGAVERHHPEVRDHLELLRRQGCSLYQMSGSGSTLFGIWTSTPEGPANGVMSLDQQSGAKYVRTRTATRVEQVFAIE